MREVRDLKQHYLTAMVFLSDFDFGISGYSVDKNGNSITISSTSVNTTATTGTFTSNAGKVETTSSCVFWLTGKSGYQEFISERPTADPIKAYIKVSRQRISDMVSLQRQMSQAE